MTHGITYGYDAFSDPTILWNHLDKVQKMKDQVWVGTFKEVMAYTKEAENTKLSIIKYKSDWLITPETILDKTLFNEPLTAVVTLEKAKKAVVKQGDKELPANIQSSKIVFEFNPNNGPILLKVK